MTTGDELKLRFETFVYYEHNTSNEDLERCKKANTYFFDNKTSLGVTCQMILKMQKVMFKILPPTSNEHFNHQFKRMNLIVGLCKETIDKLEKEKEDI